MKRNYITAKEFDEKFDNGEDIIEFLDLDNAIKPEFSIRRVNVDFPKWMVKSLNLEAKRLGVTRQSIIKFWIYEKLGSKAV